MDEPAKDEQESEISKKNAETPPEARPAAKREEEVLAFWKREKIFAKSLSKDAPKGEFVFYDGPPFATGLPHYGHILAGTIKDAIPRYKTMQGYRVPRRWGWDCHGLPLENQIEKELGIKTKRDIEELGVGKFNDAARKAVLRYADDWKRIIPRFGRWVDMENDYRTMDATYTESVWWAFKNLHDKGLVYEGFKPMHLCPRCGTTLANFEVAQGYKDITDLTVTVKLKLKDEPNTYLLAWTTTPWTLPGNMAAAVNADAKYVKITVASELPASASGQGGNASAGGSAAQAGEEQYILAKDRLEVIKGAYTVEKEMRGSELVGKSYEPPFPYFKAHEFPGKDKAWKVYAAPYVTMEDGTGLVHLAPAFGAEDLELAQKEGIPVLHHVNKDGFFVDAVTDFQGMQAKPKDDPQSTDVAIIKYLAVEGLLFAKEKITHSYPHCWRCDTPLLNYATSSWFVSVSKFKNKLVSENKKIRWVPMEVGDKRFGNWLENARDWAISRARYWGAPLPVWRNPKTKKDVVIGSVEDLKRFSKKSGNKYFVMRHGESEKNVKDVISARVDDGFHLTVKGTEDATRNASVLKGANVTKVFASPVLRAQETAQAVCDALGLPYSAITVDGRLRDYANGPAFDLRPESEWWEAYPDPGVLYEHGPEGGESVKDMNRRLGEFLYEVERNFEGETILIVSHGWPVANLHALAMGANQEKTVRMLADYRTQNNPAPAQIAELSFVPLPHNEHYELDLHRPYIDEVKLEENGERLERVKDVFDCWFESGSMSYAQNHYPFANKDVFEPKPGWFGKSRGYPADFIAEGLDQTRGWFYSLLVLGVGLFGKASYKNVIVNGIVLAEDGQKMSKRLQNYPDPVDVLEKYGADAIRYYLLASPLMHGEDLNFSEKGVGEVASKLIGRLTNVLSFYELYAPSRTLGGARSGPLGQVLLSAEGTRLRSSVLDRWILARLNQTITEVTAGMESYELDRAARPLMSFVEDFSTWYVRRSRDRFKGDDTASALETTRYVLETFSKIAAPFIPFTAEYVFKRVSEKESVHLESWPVPGKLDAALVAEMEDARKAASLALEARQKANIKVRQPLATLSVTQKLSQELKMIVADEVNVKEVIAGAEAFALDTALTPELEKEGELRDLIREIQDLRKAAGLHPKQLGFLYVPIARREQIEKYWPELAKATNLKFKAADDSFKLQVVED